MLNADTVVRARHGAGACSSRLDDEPRLGACGPRIRNLDGSDYPSARTLPSIPGRDRARRCSGCGGRRTRSPLATASSTPIPPCRASVDWVSGAAIWLRRDALDDVGGWDERYFMYLEDTDLCWRLRHAGWDVAYEPAGVVVHVQGASTSRRPYRMLLEHHRSAWRFARGAAHRRAGRAAARSWPSTSRCALVMAMADARVAGSVGTRAAVPSLRPREGDREAMKASSSSAERGRGCGR